MSNKLLTTSKGITGIGMIELINHVDFPIDSEIIKLALQALIAIMTLVSVWKKKDKSSNNINTTNSNATDPAK